MTDYKTVLVEKRGAVTLVTLNRPQALNALNSEVLARTDRRASPLTTRTTASAASS